MKRTLKDTDRNVKFVIDNHDRVEIWADGGDQPWTANVYVDGVLALAEAALGRTPDQAFALIATALEQSGALNDLPVPVPEKDRELLLSMLKGIAATWDTPEDIPDWRDNEYVRGQLELVTELCRVATDQEFEDGTGDMDTYRDRITTWLEQQVWNDERRMIGLEPDDPYHGDAGEARNDWLVEVADLDTELGFQEWWRQQIETARSNGGKFA